MTQKSVTEKNDTRRDIRLGPLSEFIGFNLRRAQDASFEVFARHADSENMAPGRFAALMIISQNPDLTQADLGQAMARDKSSITPLVKRLEQEGLIERRPSREDRRSLNLRLTPTGEATLSRLLAHAQEHDRKLDRLVGAEDKALFLQILKKITSELN